MTGKLPLGAIQDHFPYC